MSSTLTLSTPQSVVQCQNTTISWTGGVAPFYVGYVASGTITTATATGAASPAVTFRTDQHNTSWVAAVASGVQITFKVTDSNNQIAYSAPVVVGNSTDQTCLPGYAPGYDSSGGDISAGAISGIAIGSVAALALVVTTIVLLVLRRRRRKRRLHNEQEGKFLDEKNGEEPKMVPYVRGGNERELDLAEERTVGSHAQGAGEGVSMNHKEGWVGSSIGDGRDGTSRSSDHGSGENDNPLGATGSPTGSNQVGQLERETKQMMGVAPPDSATVTATGRPLPPPPSSLQTGSPTSDALSPSTDGSIATTTPMVSSSSAKARLAANPPPTITLAPVVSPATGAHPARSPITVTSPTSDANADQAVEFVRHTDGGVMRVELPPLYSDVPRREDQ